MSTTISNYDGSIVTVPQQVVRPGSVEEIQAIMQQEDRYPSPVRAMGSFHSLTPCASSSGTVVSMAGLKKIVKIDPEALTFTAEAGLQLIEGAEELRRHGLQFVLNIEIGNMTIGAAACCQSKDSLDGVEFGQVNSYVTGGQVGEPFGRARRGIRRHEPRAHAADSSQLRPRRHRLRGDLQGQTLGDRPVRLPRARRGLADTGHRVGGDRVQSEHRVLDRRSARRHSNAQSRHRIET